MTLLALAGGIRALAPSGLATYVGEAPLGSKPSPPWLVLRVSVPGVDQRAESSTVSSFTARLQATLAGTSENSVLVNADRVQRAFEGARPVAEGWTCGPLLLVGAPSLYVDDVASAATNSRIHVAVLSFAATVVRLP